jgi:hypothetical protein
MPEAGAGIQSKSQTFAAFDFNFVYRRCVGNHLDPPNQKNPSLAMR